MILNKKIDKHTVLAFVEPDKQIFDIQTEKTKTTKYSLYFGFYDCHYQVRVTREDIDDDNNYGCELYGTARLFGTFDDMCREELWELIKKTCNDFDKWYDELQAE